jgi:hypothetical protein
VVTKALRTDINIKKIIRIIHVSQPYKLTSFVQQLGYKRQNREISESVIITRVKSNSG